MLPTKQIFNARTQTVEAAQMRVDKNGEIVATFADESFVKFPAKIIESTPVPDGEATITETPITAEVLDTLIAKHEEDNTGQEIITPEMEAQAAANKEAALQAIGVDTSDQEAVISATSEPEATPPSTDQTNDGNTMPAGDTTNASAPSSDPSTPS